MDSPDTWYSLALGDAMFAFEPAEQIARAFMDWQDGQGAGKSALAVFTRNDSEGRLHCQTLAFFPPAAAPLALRFGAQPCPKPARDGLGLLAGDPAAWSALFPEAG